MSDKQENDIRKMVKNGVQELQKPLRKYFAGAAQTASDGRDRKQEEKTIRITMLGTSSVGKTAFLAGVYQTLFLHQDGGVSLRMNDKYDGEEGYTSIESIAMVSMDGTVSDFPPGTSETKVYGMSLYIGKERCCDFEFMDYRGAFVREIAPGRSAESGNRTNQEDVSQFRKQLEQSDYILLFLDAVQVSKSEAEERYNNCRMGMMSLIFSQVLKWKNSHVIVVLTKVDNSCISEEDKRDNYRGLCDKTMEICGQIRDNCESFVIVPVSAVGEGRTEDVEEIHQGDTVYISHMKEGISPEPLNVDGVILYACRAILDKKQKALKEELAELQKEQEKIEPVGKLRTKLLWRQTQGADWEELGQQINEIDRRLRKVTQEIETINAGRLTVLDRNYVYYRKESEER